MKIFSTKKDKVKTFNELCGNNAENIKKPPKNYTTKATDNIKDIKRCEKIPKWHNAEKEKPKVDGYYLCTIKLDNNRYDLGLIEYNKNRYKDNNGWYYYSVIAWMKLPPML